VHAHGYENVHVYEYESLASSTATLALRGTFCTARSARCATFMTCLALLMAADRIAGTFPFSKRIPLCASALSSPTLYVSCTFASIPIMPCTSTEARIAVNEPTLPPFAER
jgi:hypothetical protein